MPHLKFRGIDKKVLIENSKELIDGLTEIIACNRDWFTVEHIETEYIFDGRIVSGYIFVEVSWFERDKETKNKTADFLTKFCKKYSSNRDTTVIFYPLLGENYYDNGEHF